MTSKQEKLAAARRKLKEFQGKNKEAEFLKQKNASEVLTSKTVRDSPNDLVIHNSPLFSDRESVQCSPLDSQSYCVRESITEGIETSLNERKTSQSSLNGSNTSKLWPEYHIPTNNSVNDLSDFSEEKSDCANGLIESHNTDEKNNFGIKNFSNTPSRDSNVTAPAKILGSSDVFSPNNTIKLNSMEGKEFFNKDADSKNCLDDVIKPLQTDLQNHAQTITILVQQLNDAQIALTKTQGLLNEKSGEAAGLKQQVAHLTSSTKSLSQRLADAESVIMKLKLEKEDNLQKQDEIKSLADKFHTQLDEKEEELKEIKRKQEEKNKECKQLLFSLQEAQGQLSLYQIQLQQYSAEGHSGLASQVSELQNENMSLKQKVLELETKLEVENREKDEASQKFHIYAQQCNSQLTFLNSQIKSLKTENENLTQENKILTENLSEVENMKGKDFSSESFESEIANLHNQLSALSEKNNQLNCILKKKEEDYTELEKTLDEKELQINKLLGEVRELEEENKTLANEAETPKANERLLATMESDKVAAAKAVSQNQKLKEQVLELEKAFMKISEEKLDLTNQLAHEKHINVELQNLLKIAESKHQDDHHEHHNGHECNQENEQTQALVNDSNEVEELRNIVRQLQDDKMELTARINLYESKKLSTKEEGEMQQQRYCQHEHHNEDANEPDNPKLLLQQMEEKVKKTMNEIAVLDEEKEKLEHLVLQLQGETETIGEYITLYQKQRMLLRQRAQEKDIQLLQLSKDKEELKSKLVALDELVQRLIVERENSAQTVSQLSGTNSSVAMPEITAGKIRDLINEIGSTTLINNQTVAFEHCSCCSGRLITI